MSDDNVRLKKIWKEDDATLGLLWTDEHRQLYDVVALRRHCPCAVCIDEWSGEKRLQEGDVKEDVRPVRIDSVGRYALTIQFSDGHGTGIYSYKYLRSLETQLKRRTLL